MYTKLLMLLAFISTIFTAAGQQKCIDSSFINSYYIPGQVIEMQQVLNTRNDGLLILGRNSYSDLKSDVSLIKLDSSGTTQWGRILKRKTFGKYFTVTAISSLKDGSVALGITLNDPSDKKIGIVKLDSSGNIMWEKVYQNNFGTSKVDVIFRIITINEGKDGDLILNTYEDGSVIGTNKLVNGYGITLTDRDGNVRWSFQYSGVAILGKNKTIYRDGKLVYWGKVDKDVCDSDRDFINSITLNYNTGKIEKVLRYCISKDNENMSIVVTAEGQRDDPFAADVLANGETVVYVSWPDSKNRRMYLRFDRDLNFLRGYRIIPFQNILYYDPISHAVNKQDGSLFFLAVYRSNSGSLLHHYSVYVKGGGENVSQFYFDDTGSVTFGSGQIQLQNNGRINEILDRDGAIIINNMGTAPAAPAFCVPAVDSAYGYLQPYQMVQSETNYQWENERDGAYSAVNTSEIVSTAVEVDRQENCKKVSYCDTLRIMGDNRLCFDKNSRVTFTAMKNPECNHSIEWSADTSYTGMPETVNDTSVKVSLRKPGTFKLFATVGGCGIRDSMEITVYEKQKGMVITAQKDLCPGTTTMLYATKGFVTYHWNEGGTDDSLPVSHPGMYAVSGTDGCGNSFSDSAEVGLIDTSFNLAAHASVCRNDSLKITLPASVKSISWYPEGSGVIQSNELILYPSQSEIYSMKVNFSKDCFSQKTINVMVNDCPETVFFPNSFTPNNDGLNDYFRPALGKNPENYELKIFNRYGQNVFSSNDPNKGWDGMLKSSPVDAGAFTWICEYRFRGKEKKRMKGVVYLLR